MITLIYPVHNRLHYTRMSLPIVIEEAKNPLVKEFIIFDDNSEEDTVHYIKSLKIDKILGKKFTLIRKEIGNSTDQINHCIKNCNTKYIYKVDNDILIPEGAVQVLFNEIDRRKKVSFLMMRETAGKPYIKKLDIRPASHIGGVGIFRMATLKKKGLITPKSRFFGFTQYQAECIKEFKTKAAILKHCGNTNLDMSKWSRVDKFVKKGWSRNIVKDARNTKYRRY